VFRAGPSGVREHGWVGGFDCVLGNPPWERVKLQEKEFFASSAPAIAEAKNKAAREKLIAELADEEPALHAAFLAARRHAEGESHLMRSSGRYPLCGRGDVNTYAVFAESMRTMLSPDGQVGVIVPTGIATDDTTKLFFADLIESGALVSLYDFENAAPAFPGVHRSYKFCLLTVAGSARGVGSAIAFSFYAHQVDDLNDPERRFALTADDIRLLNPNTRTCPIFRTSRDADLTKEIYRRVPVLVREGDPEGNTWGVRLSTMFHMTNDSGLFRTRDELEVDGWTLEGNLWVKNGEKMLPVYEGKMVAAWDHRAANIIINPDNAQRSQQKELLSNDEKSDPRRCALPYLWVAEKHVNDRRGAWIEPWSLTVKRVSSSSNRRTVVPCLVPDCGISYTLYRVETSGSIEQTLALGALLGSFAFDYIVRQKSSQPSLTMGTLYEAAMPTPQQVEDRLQGILGAAGALSTLAASVIRLSYSSLDLAPAAKAIGHSAAPMWSPEARASEQALVDALCFVAFSCSRAEAEYILDSFRGVREAEVREFGDYRTRKATLDAYDRFVGAGASAQVVA